MSKLPEDANGNAIQALRLRKNGSHVIAATGTSARNTIAFGDKTQIVSIYATTDVFIRFSETTGDTASITDHFIPSDMYIDLSLGDLNEGRYNYLNVLRKSVDGQVYISEKE